MLYLQQSHLKWCCESLITPSLLLYPTHLIAKALWKFSMINTAVYSEDLVLLQSSTWIVSMNRCMCRTLQERWSLLKPCWLVERQLFPSQMCFPLNLPLCRYRLLQWHIYGKRIFFVLFQQKCISHVLLCLHSLLQLTWFNFGMAAYMPITSMCYPSEGLSASHWHIAQRAVRSACNSVWVQQSLMGWHVGISLLGAMQAVSIGVCDSCLPDTTY